uniref:Deoxynucleoside kinase-like n=1 Tax=Hirondellea gigas TaxID=1518452 RepID=A0A6A7G024_9CRUS
MSKLFKRSICASPLPFTRISYKLLTIQLPNLFFIPIKTITQFYYFSTKLLKDSTHTKLHLQSKSRLHTAQLPILNYVNIASNNTSLIPLLSLYKLCYPSTNTTTTITPLSQFHTINQLINTTMMQTKRLNRPITICVEGNIGSGKTTLLNHLATKKGVEVFEEPVNKWRNMRGKNLLELMYQDPTRWSHLFQTYVQLTMMQIHVQPCNANIKVMERSIYSARHCFVENLYQTGKMSEPEYNVYCEWYNMATNQLGISVDLIVYLSAEPTVVQKRILERGRSEEASIPLSYLQQLHALHQRWLGQDTLPAPLLVLDTDMTVEEMCSAIEEHLAVILEDRRQSSKAGSGSGDVIAAADDVTADPVLLSSPTRPKTAAAIN